MRDDTRYIAGGAALGAVLGALAAWAYVRYSAPETEEATTALVARPPLDRAKVFRLLLAVIALVRQVLELG